MGMRKSDIVRIQLEQADQGMTNREVESHRGQHTAKRKRRANKKSGRNQLAKNKY
jgi:hypothetical protein